jgi:hypothetical protein
MRPKELKLIDKEPSWKNGDGQKMDKVVFKGDGQCSY